MTFIFITTWKQLRLELYALWLWNHHSPYRQNTESAFSHFEFESKFYSGWDSPRPLNLTTQVPGSYLWEPEIARVLTYPLFRCPRCKEELDSFYPLCILHISSRCTVPPLASAAEETPYKDVTNMLKGRRVNKWKKRVCTPDGRGSEEKIGETSKWKQKKWRISAKIENIWQINMCAAVDKPSSNTHDKIKPHEPMYWVSFFLFRENKRNRSAFPPFNSKEWKNT